MVVKVNLYWQHDLDLLALNANPNFNLGLALKKVIVAYARNERFTISLPPPQDHEVYLNSCSVHFQLNNKTEADVIQVLDGFRPGHRNPAIKQIFRGYLEAPYLEPYFEGTPYLIKSRVPTKRERTVTKKPKDPNKYNAQELGAMPTPIMRRPSANIPVKPQTNQNASAPVMPQTGTVKQNNNEKILTQPPTHASVPTIPEPQTPSVDTYRTQIVPEETRVPQDDNHSSQKDDVSVTPEQEKEDSSVNKITKPVDEQPPAQPGGFNILGAVNSLRGK